MTTIRVHKGKYKNKCTHSTLDMKVAKSGAVFFFLPKTDYATLILSKYHSDEWSTKDNILESRDLQIRVQVRLSNFKSVTSPELSLLPVV